jgi:NAD(P)H-dependent FMN reductase
MQIKILAFCGSSRRDSLNQKLLDTAVLGALDAGAPDCLVVQDLVKLVSFDATMIQAARVY